ncbi:hypothetical protein [Longimicrobium sp.]|nr:hypothetical protein [Longimicrobium sp.]HEX6040176.1 hypothetical protein [Longimicrobium sp.]
MEKPVLNPEDLVVTSFDTTFGGFQESQPTTDDPTPNTRCFDCPP